jgi:hypothetical protein
MGSRLITVELGWNTHRVCLAFELLSFPRLTTITDKKANHTAGSLPDLVEKLVKNWEIEASHKTNVNEWRTIDPAQYSLSANGGPAHSGQKTIEIGTYNSLLASGEYYCPAHSSFDSSHKAFKRMMPAFSWEVIEVYSGPPDVSFRWRHWGSFEDDYVGWNK